MHTVISRLVIAILLVLLGRNCAYAEGKGDFLGVSRLTDWAKDRVENSSGSDATSRSVSAYDTIVIGLNKPLHEEGWRLRLYTDYSAYRYTVIKNYAWATGNGGKRTGYNQFAVDFLGLKQNADAMLGYQLRYDRLWLKLYAGAAYAAGNATQTAIFRTDGMDFSLADYIVPPGDPRNLDAGSHWGGKFLGEAWMPVSGRTWASLNASLSTINTNYTASARLGYEPPQWLPSSQWLPSKVTMAFGPEAAASGNTNYHTLRAGAFARIGTGQQELTVSGGRAVITTHHRAHTQQSVSTENSNLPKKRKRRRSKTPAAQNPA
jgi:hypothetical protein